MALYKKPPLEICFLSTNWVPIEVKVTFYMVKVTQVILYPGMEYSGTTAPVNHIFAE